MAKQKINSAQMTNGLIKYRQGGTSGDASWLTNGTTNTDVSAKNTFIQVGSAAATALSTNVTFPVAFNQVPIIMGSISGGAAAYSQWYIVSQSTTGFSFVCSTYANVSSFSWMAIGQ